MTRIRKKVCNKLNKTYLKIKDLYFDTRSTKSPVLQYQYIKITELDTSKIDLTVARHISEMYLAHRFDLLGSGWVKNTYSSEALGIEGYKYSSPFSCEIDREGSWLKKILFKANVKNSKRIWGQVSQGYIPIDWQKDYKSGYRWSNKLWYKNQAISPVPGADIKVPWELARMQHLPQLAIFALAINDSTLTESFIKEFRDQVLDFMATNPPRMGVNWTCTMDVAIRATNMLIAADLFHQMDSSGILDEEFKTSLAAAIYEHGNHIVNNLEWHEQLTTNHYLSNIVGLSFIASYLESNSETDAWLAFSAQELISEFKKQFHEDGSNFEGSTSYHSLSLELVTYATALLLGLGEDKRTAFKRYNYKRWKGFPHLKESGLQEYHLSTAMFFPEWYIQRLYRAGTFVNDITKPTGEIAQIGDNDSGRLYTFSPCGSKLSINSAVHKYINLNASVYKDLDYCRKDPFYWDRNSLDHRPLLSGLAALFPASKLEESSLIYPLENSIIKNLTKGKKFSVQTEAMPSVSINSSYDYDEFYKKENIIYSEKNIKSPINDDMKWIIYPNSGIFIGRSYRMHLIISAGANGQNGFGGHDHNDKLSFELNIEGKDLILDPGTYVYTPLTKRRNEFRSVNAHHGIVVKGIEQNDWSETLDGLFRLKNEVACHLINLTNKGIVLGLSYKDIKQVREFIIEDHRIIVNDYCNRIFEANINRFGLYSNGYGKLIKND